MKQAQALFTLVLLVCIALVACTPATTGLGSEPITAESFDFPPSEFREVTLEPVFKEADPADFTEYLYDESAEFSDEDAGGVVNGPVGETHSAVRGPDGNIWASSRTGVSRFDGDSWIYDNVFEGEIVSALTVAPDGSVVAAGDVGVRQHKNGEWVEIWPGTRGLLGGPWWPIAMGPEGDLWMGSAVYDYEGVAHFDGEILSFYSARESIRTDQYISAERGLVESREVEDALFPGFIASFIAVDPDGVAWSLTFEGVVRYDGQEWMNVSGDEYFAGDVMSVASSPDNSLWFVSTRGFSHFDGQLWTKYTIAGDQGESEANVEEWPNFAYLTIAPNGEVWFAGWYVINHFDGATLTVYFIDLADYFQPDSFTGNPLVVDAEGTLWLAGSYKGIYRFMPASD